MNSGPKNDIINQRLWNELIVRNRFVCIPQTILCVTSLLICFELHMTHKWTTVMYAFVLLGCIVKNYVFNAAPENTRPNSSQNVLYYAGIFSTSCGWLFQYIMVQRFFGEYSPQTVFFYMLIAGQCSAAITIYAARPISFFVFAFPLLSTAIIHPFLLADQNALVTALMIVFMASFFVHQLKLSHVYLKTSIENELALTLEKDKLQSLINAVPGFVSFIDNDLRYKAINEFGKNYYREELIIGKSVGFLNPEASFPQFIYSFMNSNRETQTMEIDIEINESIKTFIVSAKKIYDPEGGAVIVSVPMDELVEAREYLKIQEAKSQYTAKLVSLGEMAAGIAHEINNPLAIIQGSSDQMERLLQRPHSDISKLIDYNIKIQKTVDRISRIIKSLKGLARNGESDPFVILHFQTILDPCIEITRQRFRDEQVELEIVPFDTSLEILGQEIQLSQVLMNIINNAFDAAVEGSNPRWVKVELKDHQTHFDIIIQDSGNGIKPELRSRIMDPFFTTKPVNKGTGLGLSISKNIMEKHNGSLILDDSYPHTTFIMRFNR